MPSNSSNNFTDEFRSEAQLTWMALLLASFALGVVFVWSLSNQALLMPGVGMPDAPVAQLSQLPKREEVVAIGSAKAVTKVIGETPVFERKEQTVKAPVVTTTNDNAATTVSKTQSEVAPIIDTPESVAVVPDPKIEVTQTEAVEATQAEALTFDLETMELEQVELVQPDVELIAEVTPDATQAKTAEVVVPTIVVPPLEDPATIAELQQAPVVDPVSAAVDLKTPVKPEDGLVLAELTASGLASDALPAAPADVAPVGPAETAFEILRREELASLANYSKDLQIDPNAEALDSVATSQLFQIFDLLFLYSETPVSITVQSNDTDSTLSNITQSQRRGEKIVDYLVLSGLDRSRFEIVAESTTELTPGSHIIAIQATLDP